MARIPLTENEIRPGRLALNLEKVGLTDEQFYRLCTGNPDLHIELTARKELVIMPPSGAKTDWRNNRFCYRLTEWALRNGTGETFGPSAGFSLPDGSKRGPDAAWIARNRWNLLDPADQEKLAHIAPDFVLELMSSGDRLGDLQNKMEDYISNGVKLGWLIDPFNKNVYVYRPGLRADVLRNPSTIDGAPVLPGFVFAVTEIW